MRSTLSLLWLALLACQSPDEKLLTGCRARIEKLAATGALVELTDVFLECHGQRTDDRANRFARDTATLLNSSWEPIRSAQLALAKSGPRPTPMKAEADEARRAKMFAALADPALDQRFAALKDELRAASAAGDSAREALDAAEITGKVLLSNEGQRSEELLACAEEALRPLLPGAPWHRRNSAAPARVREAALGWVGLTAKTEVTQYVNASGNVGGLVPRSLHVGVALQLPSRKGLPARWDFDAEVDTPSAFGSDGEGSAAKKAAAALGDKFGALNARICAQLREKVRQHQQ